MNIFDELISRVNRDNYPGDYDNGFTLAESIARLITLIKELENNVDENNNNFNELKNKYGLNIDEIEKLRKDINDFKNGNSFPKGSITMDKLSDDFMLYLSNFIKNNIYNSAKFIEFYISDDGYFCINIPDNWKDIIFSSDGDGHLILIDERGF